QQESEEFDPEDINYNTFRWITSDHGYAMGPSRANPLTGEIFDADILFDASIARYYRQAAGARQGQSATAPEAISPIRTVRLGLDLPQLALGPRSEGWDDRADLTSEQKARLRAVRQGLCRCGPCLKRELNLLSLALVARGEIAEGD